MRRRVAGSDRASRRPLWEPSTSCGRWATWSTAAPRAGKCSSGSGPSGRRAGPVRCWAITSWPCSVMEFGLREEARDDTFQEVLAAPDGGQWTAWIRSWPLVRRGHLGISGFCACARRRRPGLESGRAGRASRSRSKRACATRPESARALLEAKRSEDPAADDLERMTRCRSAASRRHLGERSPRWARRRLAHRVAGRRARLRDHLRALGAPGAAPDPIAPRPRHGLRLPRQRSRRIPHRVGTERRGLDPFSQLGEGLWQVPAKARYWSP